MRDVLARDRIGEEEALISIPVAKRCFDVILASFGLVVSLPLWIMFALAIRLEDHGPVFFAQRRWGQGKKPINILKFRTMVVDADEKFGCVQAGQDDRRITRVGRILRATSLDEMPQILSILRGDMSWVGPRALAINEVQINEGVGHLPDDSIDGFEIRCLVKPGLTGMAQLYASRDVPRRQKFRYDRLYIEKQTLLLDIKLIALSFWITFRARWGKRG